MNTHTQFRVLEKKRVWIKCVWVGCRRHRTLISFSLEEARCRAPTVQAFSSNNGTKVALIIVVFSMMTTMASSSSSSSSFCCSQNVGVCGKKMTTSMMHQSRRGKSVHVSPMRGHTRTPRAKKKKKISTSISAMGSSFEQKFGPGGSGAFSDGIGGGGGMAGPSKGEVSAQDLALLQQRLGGQRITMEGAGAQRLEQKGLIDAQGNLMSAGQKPIKKSNPDQLEINYDPDGVLGEVEDDSDMLIDRHLAKRKAQELEKEKEKLKEEWKKKRKELEDAREARPEPTSPAELVTYFFETEFNEMEFEIVRNRPKLNEEFFAYLKSQMEDDAVDEDMKGKIEALNTVTSNFVGFVDQTTRAMLQPKERMMKLLTAKDKRAMILEMVDKNELDMNLMALLMTNINNAKAAGLDQEAEFMQKVYSACAKFVDGA